MSLENLRKEIESVNICILKLLAKRNNVSKKIGTYKKKHNLSITDKKKEKEIFAKIKSQSKRLGLHERFVKDVFNKIIKESKRLQR